VVAKAADTLGAGVKPAQRKSPRKHETIPLAPFGCVFCDALLLMHTILFSDEAMTSEASFAAREGGDDNEMLSSGGVVATQTLEPPAVGPVDPRTSDGRLPLSATVNPLHRAFIGLPIRGSLMPYVRVAAELSESQDKPGSSSSTCALCREINLHLNNMISMHTRSTAPFGLAAQFSVSNAILATATRGGPRQDDTASLMRPSPDAPRYGLEPVGGADAAEGQCSVLPHPSTNCREAPPPSVFEKPFSLPKLPADFEKILEAVETSCEIGVGTSPTLKTLLRGSEARLALVARQLFGKASSTMLSKRGTIAKLATRRGGWLQLGKELRAQRKERLQAKTKFGYTEVHAYCVKGMNEEA